MSTKSPSKSESTRTKKNGLGSFGGRRATIHIRPVESKKRRVRQSVKPCVHPGCEERAAIDDENYQIINRSA